MGVRLSDELAGSAHEKPRPTRTMMSMNEMPVTVGMQWNANVSSGEEAIYETRKKNIQELPRCETCEIRTRCEVRENGMRVRTCVGRRSLRR